jgi:hypothetical protein
MKTTEKKIKEIQEIEKQVAEVCDVKKIIGATINNDGVVDEITGIVYPKENLTQKKSRNITVSLSYGRNLPYLSIKKQIELQGFEICKGLVDDAENIRKDLHSLNEAGILSGKQLMKCFKKLNNIICRKIINSELKDGEIAIKNPTNNLI